MSSKRYMDELGKEAVRHAAGLFPSVGVRRLAVGSLELALAASAHGEGQVSREQGQFTCRCHEHFFGQGFP